MEELLKELKVPMDEPLELVVLAVKKSAIRCKVVALGDPITFRKVRYEVEGEIITVKPSKLWRFKRTHYMTGEILSKRFDIAALRLKPLALKNMGVWEPEDEYWGEAKDPLDIYLKPNEVGVKIGGLSFSNDKGFNGVLPWGPINNRPFLRCLHGYGLSLWRLGKSDEAREVFNRMLWLNPLDNQGIRFLLADIDSGKTCYELYKNSDND